jgi:hypothetical protein
MLELNVKLAEDYDETNNKFIGQCVVVQLEHSLLSVSKWESIWKKPFLGKEDKTQEQTLSYIRMMIIGGEIPPEGFHGILRDHIPEIQNYIADEMTASTVPDIQGSQANRETVTSELIYYWLVALQIPFVCETWHLNRLLMLVRVTNFKNKPPDKKRMPNMADRRALNRKRLAQHNTRG